MKVATVEQMKAIDRRSQEEFGMAGALLMERAALAVRDAMRERYGALAGRRIVVCCGKGNNGGDGLALARILMEDGAAVTALLAFALDQHRGLAGLNLACCRSYGVPLVSWASADLEQLGKADLFVDALLGTGATGAPTGTIAGSVAFLNRQSRPVVAIDAPTGVDMDNGAVSEPAVRADLTVTFGLPKPGLLSYPGAERAGRLVVASIGFPPALLHSPELTIEYVTGADIRPKLPRRSPAAHKGTAGQVLIIGGSPGLTGAPAIAALAALRGGCGLVTVALRPGLPFPEKPLEAMAVDWDRLQSPDRFDGIVIGPGMGLAGDGRAMLAGLIGSAGPPLVVDADGLNLLSREPELFETASRPIILTPHPGEMSRLTGASVAAVQADRIGMAVRLAKERQVIVVLKGARTVTATPDGRSYINSSGNPGMATAGMGDALAGVIASLLAQGMSPEDAAVAGVYLHGLAGDLAARRLGPVGILAGDLVSGMPEALGKVMRDESV
jgi:hydroxyethylthiazole kinase-like uncharacterized protein yjeF